MSPFVCRASIDLDQTGRRVCAILIPGMPNMDRPGGGVFNSVNLAYLVAAILVVLMYLYTRGYL